MLAVGTKGSKVYAVTQPHRRRYAIFKDIIAK